MFSLVSDIVSLTTSLTFYLTRFLYFFLFEVRISNNYSFAPTYFEAVLKTPFNIFLF